LKKLAFVLTKAMGLLLVSGNKKNEEIPQLPLEIFREGSRAKDRILRILFVWGKCVGHTNKNF
jgi:hypothetical protein